MEEENAVLLEKKNQKLKWEVIMKELKKLSYIATPMVAVTVSQNLLRVASMMMVGHLGQLSFSGAAVATSLTNVTGFSLLFGMASALETLCGQAYGAGQYEKLGTYTYAAIISLLLVCLPVSLLWIFMDKLLILINQDPLISIEAGKYAIWLIPSLFPYAVLQLYVRYLQSQSLILPMLLSSLATLFFHIPVCWALVFKFELGNCGAALAIGLSYWINVIILGFYVKYSSACMMTRIVFSKKVFSSIKEFFHFAIPSAVMACLEWWSFELIILLSGLLPNPQLETSVLSICLTIAALHYYIPYSFGTSASTRVSNELGAGNPESARLAAWLVIYLAIGEAIITSTVLLCFRSELGYAFGYEKAIIDYVNQMSPLLCISMIMDSLQAVLSGVTRGSGWQHTGAYINLGSYYAAGIPIALLLSFVFNFGGKGLWIGLIIGSVVQFALLFLLTNFTNWEQEAIKARERLFKGDNSYVA